MGCIGQLPLLLTLVTLIVVEAGVLPIEESFVATGQFHCSTIIFLRCDFSYTTQYIMYVQFSMIILFFILYRS